MRDTPSIMVWGVGAFAQGVAQILKEDGAQVCTYLTRDYGHFPPSLAGPVFDGNQHPDPCSLIRERKVDYVIPMSIDWALAPWIDAFLESKTPLFSPQGRGMLIERERDYARQLCARHEVPYPRAHVAKNRLEAEFLVNKQPRPYVIKNPLCSPTSPIHTVVCETVEDTLAWLPHLDYAEGVYLQEYLGRAEAGHLALVSDGEIHSVATNQEYKRSFNGNMGIVAGAPLGGLVEQDPEDRYGLARDLLHPLLPWFQETGYHGPIQVTAVRAGGQWQVLEYNIRSGITCTAILLRMLKHPAAVLQSVAANHKVIPEFRENTAFGCSLTLAGYGYPYITLEGPSLPVEVTSPHDEDCDVWWNEVTRGPDGQLFATGHRVADVVALAPTLAEATQKAYDNIGKIRCLGSYFRTDIGKSLWPPGSN